VQILWKGIRFSCSTWQSREKNTHTW